jgi:hypothetical protein
MIELAQTREKTVLSSNIIPPAFSLSTNSLNNFVTIIIKDKKSHSIGEWLLWFNYKKV